MQTNKQKDIFKNFDPANVTDQQEIEFILLCIKQMSIYTIALEYLTKDDLGLNHFVDNIGSNLADIVKIMEERGHMPKL